MGAAADRKVVRAVREQKASKTAPEKAATLSGSESKKRAVMTDHQRCARYGAWLIFPRGVFLISLGVVCYLAFTSSLDLSSLHHQILLATAVVTFIPTTWLAILWWQSDKRAHGYAYTGRRSNSAFAKRALESVSSPSVVQPPVQTTAHESDLPRDPRLTRLLKERRQLDARRAQLDQQIADVLSEIGRS